MLSILPTEILLQVLAYLPLPELSKIPRLSRSLRDVVDANAMQIYHNAAVFHDMIPPGANWASIRAKTNSTWPWIELMDWRDYCRIQCIIEMGWIGQSPSHTTIWDRWQIVALHAVEEERFVIATTRHGAIRVCDTFYTELLYSMPDFMSPDSRIEYQQGFMVVEKKDHTLSVWKRTMDFVWDVSLRPPNPEAEQMEWLRWCEVHLLRPRDIDDVYPGPEFRGQFKPWGIVATADVPAVYRLCYPWLLLVTFEDAYIYDIRTTDLITMIPDLRREGFGEIRDAAMTEDFIVICGKEAVAMYYNEGESMEDPNWQCAFYLRAAEISASWTYWMQRTDWDKVRKDSVMRLHKVGFRYMEEGRKCDPQREFFRVAIHPTHSALIIVMTNARIIVVHDLQSHIYQQEPLVPQDMLEILLGPSESEVKEISYHPKSERLCVATTKGIFIVKPVWRDIPARRIGFYPYVPFRSSTADFPSGAVLDRVFISQAACFAARHLLNSITGLHITDSMLFVNWVATGVPNDLEQFYDIWTPILWEDREKEGIIDPYEDINPGAEDGELTDIRERTIASLSFIHDI